ncbi:MAG: galactokinase [Oceanipulchritudo sp.]
MDSRRQVSSSAVRAASPGRVEFIGNHVDYNGGRVLGAALNLGITATAIPRTDGRLTISSRGSPAIYEGIPGDNEPQSGQLSWVNYPLGIMAVLAEAGYVLSRGLDLSFTSDLPSGAGLSSSAAIELATMEVLAVLEGFELSRTEKVLLAQRAENTFVGVPCGILDQAVSCFGKEDHLVCIDCAETTFDTVPLPPGLHFWIFNTNCKHSLVDSLYARRHAECREALKWLRKEDPGLGYLVEAGREALHSLNRDPDIRRRAEHVIEENSRVSACMEALERGALDTVGDLLFASHASSRDLFENSTPELDALVEILEEYRGSGVVGARLTGGGFGGAVMALTTDAFTRDLADKVVAVYGERHSKAPTPGFLHVVTGEGTRLLD